MEQTELKKLACFFHQDFGFLFDSVEEGMNTYWHSLSIESKKVLSVEISNFLNEHNGKNHQSKKNAWFRLGAQWWDKKQIVPVLERLANLNL